MDAKKITLSDFHESIGGKMVPFAGFNMPVSYAGINIEHETVRRAVGVFDVNGDQNIDIVSGSYWYEGPSFLNQNTV